MPTIRQARVGEMIKRDLAEIIQKEMRDPRLALVTITSVEVARDFTLAKVFVSSLGDASDKTLALKALQGASGFLRGRLGAMLGLRTVPVLAFRYDTGIEKGLRMFELLREEKQFFVENPQEPEVIAEPVEVVEQALPEMTEDDFADSPAAPKKETDVDA